MKEKVSDFRVKAIEHEDKTASVDILGICARRAYGRHGRWGETLMGSATDKCLESGAPILY